VILGGDTRDTINITVSATEKSAIEKAINVPLQLISDPLAQSFVLAEEGQKGTIRFLIRVRSQLKKLQSQTSEQKKTSSGS